MNKIEELHHVLDLLKKHDLPLSPILEFAIKEREEQYKSAEVVSCRNYMFYEPQPNFTAYKNIKDYIREFANLSVGSAGGKKLPNKAILLIGIMSMIEIGEIVDNRIPLDKSIKNVYDSTWSNYFSKVKIPSVWIPFWYMKSEPFWHFKANGNEDLLQSLLRFAGHPSIGQMKPVIKYAYFDHELFSLMKNDENRNDLRTVLEETYLQ